MERPFTCCWLVPICVNSFQLASLLEKLEAFGKSPQAGSAHGPGASRGRVWVPCCEAEQGERQAWAGCWRSARLLPQVQPVAGDSSCRASVSPCERGVCLCACVGRLEGENRKFTYVEDREDYGKKEGKQNF